MRKFWIVCAVVCFVSLQASGEGLGGIEGTEDPQDRHQALRDAVKDIRIHYAPRYGVNEASGYYSVSNRTGLGIMLNGGFFSGRDEAEQGAEILAVTPGSPADEAGLQPGDVIVAWNGEPLAKTGEGSQRMSAEATRELVSRSRELEAGDEISLRYLRDEVEHEVTLVAREVDFGPKLVAGFTGKPDFDFKSVPGSVWRSAGQWFLPRGWLDMELVEINPELGEYFGSDHGVLVVRGPEGDETLGLASGDVILGIGGREVKNPEHVMRILRSYEPDEELSVDIIRHGRHETLTGTVPESSFAFDYRFRTSEEGE